MPTRFELHLQRWQNGCGSSDCDRANRKVYHRGDIPCDVAFVGQGPGVSEDTLGKPFCGPVGHMLDEIVAKATRGLTKPDGSRIRLAFSNIVCCMPRDEEGSETEPSAEQIEFCKPRLEEWLETVTPKLIIAVGTFAMGALEQGYGHSTKLPKLCPACGRVSVAVYDEKILHESSSGKKILKRRLCGWACKEGHGYGEDDLITPAVVEITHPGAIIRGNLSVKELSKQREAVKIREAIQNHVLTY